MSTFLFEGIVFGPIKSRRLGISLGINLLPEGAKLCNFNCIYCECGWNRERVTRNARFHPEIVVKKALEEKLAAMKEAGEEPDAITFSGNGEPTMHPEFANIIDDTLELRDRYFPKAQVCVLSNGSMVHRESVFNALKKVDRAILKFESAVEDTVCLIDNPQMNYTTQKTIERFKAFDGSIVLQTMFLRGNYNGQVVDNTTEHEILLWIDAIKQINPKEVMVYTIDRDTPADKLEKVSFDELKKIAERVQALGYKVHVSGENLADKIIEK